MVTIIYWYAIFALTTAIWAYFNVFTPIFKDLANLPNNKVYEYRTLSKLTFFLCSVVFAPPIFMLVLSQERLESFKHHLFEELLDQ